MKTEIINFYWVKNAQGDPELPPAWQVCIVDTAENMDEVIAIGGLTRVRAAVPMSEAISEGVSLEVIADLINSTAVETITLLETQLNSALQNVLTLQAANATLQNELDTYKANAHLAVANEEA